MRKYFTFLTVPLYMLEAASFNNEVLSKSMVEGSNNTSQYTSRLIKVEEESSIPKGLMSVSDIIDEHVKVKKSLRFKKIQLGHVIDSKKVDTLGKESIQHKIDKVENLRIVVDEAAGVTSEIHEIKLHPKESETDYGIYRVVSGDTLGSIAHKFAMNKKRLSTINHLGKNRKLYVGQKFKIALSQVMINSIKNHSYIIQSGDSILSIASKFRLKVKDLLRVNHLKRRAFIKKGKKILLPYPALLKKLERKEKLALKKREERKKKLERQVKHKNKVKKRKDRALVKKRKIKNVRNFGRHALRVTATAYSSHASQTDNTPFLAAWNNRIRPGMKIIAVSRDLLFKYGLRNGSKVRIGGLRGYYTVRDKMNKRYTKRIDIYMGMNRRKALLWGRKSVMLYW